MNKDQFRNLIDHAKRGDREAFARLIHECIGDVEEFARHRLWKRLRSKVDSVDVVQSTIKEALKSIERFEDRGPGSFEAWLRRLAERKLSEIANRYRAQKRDINREVRLQGADATTGGAALLPAASSSGPLTRAANAEELRIVEECLSRLEDRWREVLDLEREGMGPMEIALTLGKPPSTVSRLRADAKIRLMSLVRQHLSGQDPA